MPATVVFLRIVVVALAGALLCLPAVWNGLPFFYPDTPTYLRGAETGFRSLARIPPGESTAPAAADVASRQAASSVSSGLTSLDDKIVLAGRSVYYGALLYASQRAGSLWWVVAAQALAVAYVLQLLLVRLGGGPAWAFVGSVGALTLATPLGVYTGLLMPDVFAGLGILIIGVLCVYWRQLSAPERAVLAGLLLFGLCAHASHAAVAIVLVSLAFALRQWGAAWHGLSLTAMGVVSGCIVGAIAAEAVFVQGVTQAVGAPPLRLPHTTARLIDMGPGADFLRQHCPVAGYAVCAFAREGQTAWDEFLFSSDPARGAFALADAATKRRIAQEQWRFARDVIAHDPVTVLRGWAMDLGRQLLSFRVDLWSLRPRELTLYEGRVAPDVLAAMQTTRGWNAPAYNRALTVATYTSVIVAAGMAVGWAWRRRQGHPARVPQRLEQVAWIVVGGVLANALVCVTAAASLDRFQARVIWLLPLMALMVLAVSRVRRQARRPAAPMRATRAGQLGSVSP